MAGQRRRTLTTALVAIAVSVALVLGQSTGAAMHSLVTLVNTVIGIGGGKDNMSARLPIKLNNTVVPPEYRYIGSAYPATLDMTTSVRVGMPVLRGHLSDTFRDSPGPIIVGGYSEGALLVEQLKREVAASSNPPSREILSFLQIASPFIPNGGIFARFPGLNIPGIIPGVAIPGMGPAEPTQYDSTYVTKEYDPYGDFPAYFNPVALLNTLLGHQYAHVDTSYNPLDPQAEDNYVTVVKNSAGGFDTYILAPSRHLPLLGPIRDIAARLGVTKVSERLLGAIEPLLRIIVDMAYTDRENLKPGVRKSFSLFTPPHKIVEALHAVPGALTEGLENLVGKKRTPVAPSTALAAADDDNAPTLRSVPDLTPAPEIESDAKSDAKSEFATTTVKKKKPVAGPLERALRGTIRTVFGGKKPAAETTVPDTTTPDSSDDSGSDQDSRDGGAEAA
jgi:diacyltrehalose acyltransferase